MGPRSLHRLAISKACKEEGECSFLPKVCRLWGALGGGGGEGRGGEGGGGGGEGRVKRVGREKRRGQKDRKRGNVVKRENKRVGGGRGRGCGEGEGVGRWW